MTKSSNNTLATPNESTVWAYTVDDEAYLATRDEDGITYLLDTGRPNSFVGGVDCDVPHVPSRDTDLDTDARHSTCEINVSESK